METPQPHPSPSRPVASGRVLLAIAVLAVAGAAAWLSMRPSTADAPPPPAVGESSLAPDAAASTMVSDAPAVASAGSAPAPFAPALRAADVVSARASEAAAAALEKWRSPA